MICLVPPSSESLAAFVRSTYPAAHLGLAPRSLDQMVFAVRILDRWAGRSVAIAELSEPLLRSFLLDYSKEVRPATVNAKRRILLATWRCACDEGLLSEQPNQKRLRAMPEDIADADGWTLDEVRRVMLEGRRESGEVASIPAGPWWFALLMAAYYTGERIGAILRVTSADYSPESGVLQFRRRKNHRPRRRVLPVEAREACAPIYDPSRELLWPWPWTRKHLDQRLRMILDRAGVTHGWDRGGLWNKIRRTSGSLVEAAGGDGSKHLGNTRAVFERHYLVARLAGDAEAEMLPMIACPPASLVEFLPRP